MEGNEAERSRSLPLLVETFAGFVDVADVGGDDMLLARNASM